MESYMSFESRTTDDLVRLALAGGGFTLSAGSRTTDDLVRIALAGANKGARLTFTGLGSRTTDDLVRIALAGKGCVTLEG
jgi:DNA replication protein